MTKVKIALADDHVLLRNGFAGLVTNLGYEVLFECSDGNDLISKLDTNNLPDVVLMDINMAGMDGYQTTAWLRQNHPLVKVLAVSMYDDENAIIRMLKCGAKGYILKGADPVELRQAIEDVMTKGVHYSELVTGKLLHSIYNVEGANGGSKQVSDLNDREIEFLKLAASELTYKEIAEKMHLSPRTIDGYRDALFEKLNIKNRVGLVLFAIKQGIVQMN
ncbi:MAG: response regulator transcription factor [Chitinophagaceae bacterium]|nr:response regulator transcription factor [Chitinophagaceae bacterium]